MTLHCRQINFQGLSRQAAAVIYSLLVTRKINGTESFSYLTKVLSLIPDNPPTNYTQCRRAKIAIKFHLEKMPVVGGIW